MSLALPAGVRDTDDVATEQVAASALAHLPGRWVTACGEPMWAMFQPSAGHMARLSCRWCPACFGRSRWRLLDRNSSGLTPVNDSRARPGVGQPTKGSR